MSTIAIIVAGILIVTAIAVGCAVVIGMVLATASRADELLDEWLDTREHRRRTDRSKDKK